MDSPHERRAVSVGPLPLPIRVLVKGSSIAVLSSETNGPRENFTFPRAIESTFYAAGQPAEVRNTAEVGQRAKTSLGHWEREVLAFSPDAIVLVYGYYEAIHIALPWWLERHANSWRVRPRRARNIQTGRNSFCLYSSRSRRGSPLTLFACRSNHHGRNRWIDS